MYAGSTGPRYSCTVTQRESEVFSAVVKGHGHEARSLVSATKASLPGSPILAYADSAIRRVSRVLPEGEYEVIGKGETIRARHEKGVWTVAAI